MSHAEANLEFPVCHSQLLMKAAGQLVQLLIFGFQRICQAVAVGGELIAILMGCFKARLKIVCVARDSLSFLSATKSAYTLLSCALKHKACHEDCRLLKTPISLLFWM